MKNSYDDLREEIQNYQSNRIKIKSNLTEIIRLFNEISNHLSPEVLKCFNTENLLYKLKEFGEINEEDRNNPTLAIIGTVKAGKSFFINSLLRKSVLPVSNSACTARLTRLYYNKRNRLEIINSLGIVEKKRKLKKKEIPEKYVKLSDSERKMTSKVSSVVHVGLKIDFLQSGIDLIDSPGLGENSALTAVSKNSIKNGLPMVIYVIDGQTSVKKSDIADIIEIKNLNSNLEIIYFINKLDQDDSEEYVPKMDNIELANHKMELAFTKLQKNNLIPDSIKKWTDCPYFHGASLIRRFQYLAKTINPETTYHNQLFSKFETFLLTSLLNYFRYKIVNACDDLIDFIMAVLTKIINHAQNFAEKVQENQTQIATIKNLEGELFSKIKQVITCSKDDLMRRLIERLQRDCNQIIDPIKEAEYPLTISIPNDGIVSDPQVIEQCQENIRMVLVQGLENVIKDFVEEELFKKYKSAVQFSDFNTKIVGIKKCKEGKSPYRKLLENMLDRKYKIERSSSFSNDNHSNTTIEFMNVILSSLKDFLSNIFPQILKSNDANVKSPDWKVTQALELLEKMNIHLLAEDVCKKLIADFEIKHQSFIDALEIEMIFIHQGILDNNEKRMKIIDTAPDMFQMLLNMVAIKGNYIFNNIKDLEKIVGEMEESQTKLYKCIWNNTTIARKEIKTEKISKDKITRLSEELYYSLLLSHDRILPILGIKKNLNNFSFFYPFMKCDLKRYVQENILTLKDKISISYQAAEGLKYLHDHNVLHRNIKMKNIMIDDNNMIYLSNYGFIKSEALTNNSQIGYVDDSSSKALSDGIYKKSSDIYFFGQMMFDIFKVKQNYSKYIHSSTVNALVEPIKNDIIKSLPGVPEKICTLIFNCNNSAPNERPKIGMILDILGHECFNNEI